MESIRKKFFILSYIGSLLLIVATIVPIIKFNNQSFAFIDEFFYLSFAIIILSTINLVLVTMKKYKISLIPTILNLIIIAYGIYKILNIDGLSIIKSSADFSYGIAFILYPVGLIINIIGGLFTMNNRKEEINIINHEEEVDINLEVNEPQNINEEDIILNYEEQIPISDILNKSNIRNEQDNIIESNETISIEQTDEMLEINNENGKNIENINITTDNNIENSDNVSIAENIENDSFDNDFNSEAKNIIANENEKITDDSEISMLDENDELLDEIEEYDYKDDDDFFEEIIDEDHVEPNNIQNDDDKYTMANEITEINNREVGEINNQGLDNEIPDLSLNDQNIMVNNVQVEDKPKPEFMALNPSDIKINEKNIPKKKDKKEEEPLKKLTKRNIPMTLGRTCQFCSTELGDDERICPICGRIN
ncbi:MAG: hypothetical protein HFI86_04275 [Bacilli bacterium]|nr:hypothetical protein [Bacilli bacterium]